MKRYKYFMAGLVLTGLLPSCADDLTQNVVVDKPSSIEMLEEINSYDPLKSYINRSQYPSFKLGGALAAGDLTSVPNLAALAAANFDEVVAGNEMKYASCVDEKGNMNFAAVEDFVSAAQKYGLGIYGHTLAWHSQQQPKYMQALFDARAEELKPKPDPNQATETIVEVVEDLSVKSFSNVAWKGGDVPDDAVVSNNGVLEVTNNTEIDNWKFQYNVVGGVKTKAGVRYTVTMRMKGPKDAKVHGKIGNWSAGKEFDFTMTGEFDDFKVVGADFLDEENGFIMLQHGAVIGTVCLESVTITHEEVTEKPAGKTVIDRDESNFSGVAWKGGDVPDDAVVSNNGVLEVTNNTEIDNWKFQYNVIGGVKTKAGVKYTVTMRMKGPKDAKVHGKVGNWSAGKEFDFTMTGEFDDFKVVGADFLDEDNGFIMLQHGSVVGTICIESIQITHYEEAQAEESQVQVVELVENNDCEGTENKNYVIRLNGAGGDVNASFVDGGNDGKCIKIDVAAKVAEAWDNQFFINIPEWEGVIDDGTEITLQLDVKAAVAQKISVQTHANPGDYTGGFGDIEATTDWKPFKLKGGMPKGEKGQSHSLAFNLNESDVANTFYFDNISITIEKKIPAGEITEEEKAKVLTKAMREWIEGMMNATNGYVKAWDVVNEAIAGTGDDGEGNYPLQHASDANTDEIGGNTDVFFWQDYMGDLEYVRTAVAAAREFFKGDAAALKLFVNDYNLESDWDDNKKLKSLIAWVAKWEADGVTKIDGLGTQMHISCYEDDATNERKKEHIAKMFELMAATGKLVRVSELDMGFVDKSNTSLQTEQLTDEQHQKMADLYKFVVKTYLEKVPAAQQYGICQWCLTDSPKDSKWRGGEPTGLWTSDYKRKAAFKAVAEALSGK
ncbi:MAG: endo-1,4-beta-xylanase [Bacteroidales bacterium]|nr:endo-1,4-beta-xylanase [Bacteroidales bacterium]